MRRETPPPFFCSLSLAMAWFSKYMGRPEPPPPFPLLSLSSRIPEDAESLSPWMTLVTAAAHGVYGARWVGSRTPPAVSGECGEFAFRPDTAPRSPVRGTRLRKTNRLCTAGLGRGRTTYPGAGWRPEGWGGLSLSETTRAPSARSCSSTTWFSFPGKRRAVPPFSSRRPHLLSRRGKLLDYIQTREDVSEGWLGLEKRFSEPSNPPSSPMSIFSCILQGERVASKGD
ncbi:hypothetical protein LY78DRAFT_367360 [Colletotrichum sublineola]|nr:hypothetical protein LY78DRAFT_367360 [Colletotrichum sublineola]